MNIYLDRMNGTSGIQKPNAGTGLNKEGGAGLNKFMFDSLINDFSVRPAAKDPVQPEKNAGIDTRRNDHEYDKAVRNTRQSERHAQRNDNDKDEKHVSGKHAERPEHKDRPAEAGRQERTGDLNRDNAQKEVSENTAQAKETEGQNNNNLVAGAQEAPAQTGAVNETESGQQPDVLFADLLTGENGIPAIDVKAADISIDDGILVDLLNGKAGEALKNMQEQAAAPHLVKNTGAGEETGGAALKADELLTGLLNSNNAADTQNVIGIQDLTGSVDAGNSQADLNADNAGNEQLLTGDGLNDINEPAGPDIDALFVKAQAGADEATNNDSGETVDEDRVSSLIGAMGRAAANRTTAKEDSGRSNNSHNNGQKSDNEVQLQADMSRNNINVEGHNTKVSTEKLMSGFAENIARSGGPGNSGENPGAQTQLNSGTGNTELMAGPAVTTTGGRMGSAPQTVSGANASAFTDVVDKIVYVAKSDNRLGVTVDHKDFGKLDISLKLEKGLVNVHIKTIDRTANELVENNIQQIIESLEKNGISVGGFSVAMKNSRNHEGYGQGNRNGFNTDSRQKAGYFAQPQRTRSASGLVSIFA
ncbi:MAG: flagellar hook-length control protein FliK [Nitrospirota bacterium]|nr:flagellar hook-length control protein FliK [Nitrospirota bacterium]